MNIENASVEVLALLPFGCRPNRYANLIQMRIEPLLEFSFSSHDEFLIEVVAVDVDGCALVDLSGHEYDSILEAHGEADIVIIEDLQYTLGDDIVLRIEI